MRMDMDYAMDIVEAMVDDPARFPPPHICPPRPDDDADDVAWLNDARVKRYFEHCVLLNEAGLIDLYDLMPIRPTRVTYDGHVRLDEWKRRSRYWWKRNWFPLTVAVTTAAISVASLVLGAIF